MTLAHQELLPLAPVSPLPALPQHEEATALNGCETAVSHLVSRSSSSSRPVTTQRLPSPSLEKQNIGALAGRASFSIS
jgi:hypothetical protein